MNVVYKTTVLQESLAVIDPQHAEPTAKNLANPPCSANGEGAFLGTGSESFSSRVLRAFVVL